MPKKKNIHSPELEYQKKVKFLHGDDLENLENETKENIEVDKSTERNKVLKDTTSSNLNKLEMRLKTNIAKPKKLKSVRFQCSPPSKVDLEVLRTELHPDLIQEVDKNLEQKAERTNLTSRNVKNIIKAVLTNSEVLKLVDYSLRKTDERPVYELKLTRAKTKELVGLDQNVLFSTPIQPKDPEIEALITQELPEDSSDEEYEPHLSEDDESKASEIDLHEDDCELDTSTGTISGLDNLYRNENIGQRTRSKFSLSETPLEAIEQQFIPPDITTDMYDTDCDNDEWLNFLKGFMQPLDSGHPETNDDENDPEYNVMIDEEKESIDKEELRADRAVKVTKKELNDLMSELFDFTDMVSSNNEEAHPKVQDITYKLDKQEVQPSNAVLPANDYLMSQFSLEHCLLLKQQLQQHVQLLLQNCLLSCGLPDEYSHCFNESRARLIELRCLKGDNSSSYYNILNLESSLQLINDWSNLIMDSANEKIKNFIIEELNKVQKLRKTKIRYRPDLPTELVGLCLRSNAFLYPIFLPSAGFSEYISPVIRFSEFEDTLIAIGLDEFSTFLKCDLETSLGLSETISYVCHYLMPSKSKDQLSNHIRKAEKSKKSNPIREYLFTKQPPVIEHSIVLHTSLKVLSHYPPDHFPEKWRSYL